MKMQNARKWRWLAIPLLLVTTHCLMELSPPNVPEAKVVDAGAPSPDASAP